MPAALRTTSFAESQETWKGTYGSVLSTVSSNMTPKKAIPISIGLGMAFMTPNMYVAVTGRIHGQE